MTSFGDSRQLQYQEICFQSFLCRTTCQSNIASIFRNTFKLKYPWIQKPPSPGWRHQSKTVKLLENPQSRRTMTSQNPRRRLLFAPDNFSGKWKTDQSIKLRIKATQGKSFHLYPTCFFSLTSHIPAYVQNVYFFGKVCRKSIDLFNSIHYLLQLSLLSPFYKLWSFLQQSFLPMQRFQNKTWKRIYTHV